MTGKGRARVLVVEDDATVADIVGRYLERDGFTADHVGDGETALARVETHPPDLVLLDLMLPRLSGFEVCRRLKSKQVPVIILTARGEEGDRIMGLELGADDYVVKPFSPRELVARVKSVLRRSYRAGSAADDDLSPVAAAGIELDPRARTANVDGSPVSLTSMEFELLLFFMQHPGKVFRREELLEHVWGYSFGGTPTVTVHVQRLRKKIEQDPERPQRIATVWGAGYRFDA
ncbi:MAG: response regulator transcription factor [Actinobacteria bacterium]|nr:response regulator transcription factor [Actinomycetota bacterium]